MKKLFNFIAILTLALGFAACNDKWEPDLGDSDNAGGLSLKSLTVDVTNPDGNPAGRASYILDDFTIAVFNKATGAQVGTTYIYKSMPDIITLPVGDYYVEVTSGAVAKAAFDAPYFTGKSADFAITDGEITEIGTVTCTLANIKVTIKFSDRLTKAASADSKVTVVANDEGKLDFALTETRSGYFEALEGSSTLVASFNGTINGYAENNIRKIYDSVRPGDHYIITFDLAANPGMDDEYGDVDVDGILLDVTVEVENVDKNVAVDEDILDGSDRPGQEDPKDPTKPDEPEKPVDPTPGGSTDMFDGGKDMPDFTQTYAVDDFGPGLKSALITITTKSPIVNLMVTIDSEALPEEDLEGMYLAKNMDVANPGANEQGLTDLGLYDPSKPVKGATEATFDITNFMPMLAAIDQPGQIHKFVLTVIDEAGNTQTITLTFKS